MADDNVIPIDNAKVGALTVALLDMPHRPEPKGPFTVTIRDSQGKMFEAEFPDASGNLPTETPILGTVGQSGTALNLLTGALRAFV